MVLPTGSRYQSTERTKLVLPDGTEVPYLRRRFVPQPEAMADLQEHTVVEGDRIDNLAARYLGDPEQFWQICDANRAMRPSDLTQAPEAVGRRLRVTLPQGVPGGPRV